MVVRSPTIAPSVSAFVIVISHAAFASHDVRLVSSLKKFPSVSTFKIVLAHAALCEAWSSQVLWRSHEESEALFACVSVVRLVWFNLYPCIIEMTGSKAHTEHTCERQLDHTIHTVAATASDQRRLAMHKAI